MATAVVPQEKDASLTKTSLPGRRFDHLFFTSMALLMLLTVFIGFSRTYYLAGIFRAPLPSLIIHLHGAAFTTWILLLVTQTSLVAAGRTDIHRRLGIGGFALGCVMIVLGVLAATDSLMRGAGPLGRDTKAFYIVPLTDMLIFGTLLFFAFRARVDSPYGLGRHLPHFRAANTAADWQDGVVAFFRNLGARYWSIGFTSPKQEAAHVPAS